ncbi:O-antigen ligase [Photobacterium sp. OFAV2-7]|uniref:O-antigen ligase family protein n=1 Tax=Photobacterium sp. OFAV2-7 TaxID=2917748 RepID=UPI001EF51BA7|nr:O-antigen ligase family protein [Photobacterium sp. OFAV2-7]MCG7584500.1 O-antigen ligase family protein [Photobacterium sp. OFAV2-7]
MKSVININFFEKAIIAFFGLSVFTSKAGLNISVVLLLLLLIYSCISNKEYRAQLANSNIFILSIALYVIGLLSTVIYPSSSADTIYFARKAAFLLAIPSLFILNMRKENKELAIRSLGAGFVVAALYTIYQAISLDTWQGERIASFLDVGRWSEVLTYFIVFLIPLTLDDKEPQKRRFLFLGLIFVGFVCLVLSGSRGGMVATFIVSVLYLLAYKRDMFFKLSAAMLVILPLLMFMFPSKASVIQDRIVSITDTTSNESNSARLKMWKSGYLFVQDKYNNNPKAFFFGNGPINFEKEYTLFINSTNKNIVNDYSFFSYQDNHNGILDAANKLGVVYELLFLLLIALIAKNIFKASPNIKYSGLCVILAFFIVGIFYTNQLEYQTICMFYFISISLPRLQENTHA